MNRSLELFLKFVGLLITAIFLPSLAFGSGEVVWEGTQKSKGVALFGAKEKALKITTEGVFLNGKFTKAEHLSKEDACLYGMTNFPGKGYYSQAPAWSRVFDGFEFPECSAISRSRRASFTFKKESFPAKTVLSRDDKALNPVISIIEGAKSVAKSVGLTSDSREGSTAFETGNFTVSSRSNLSKKDDREICRWASEYKAGMNRITWRSEPFFQKYVDEAILRGLDCTKSHALIKKGVVSSHSSSSEKPSVIASSSFADLWKQHGGEIVSDTKTTEKPTTRQGIRKQSGHSPVPSIHATSTRVVGKIAIIDFKISNHDSVRELSINGRRLENLAERFSWEGYVPVGASNVIVEVTDSAGRTNSKSFIVERSRVVSENPTRLPAIDPTSGPKAAASSNALAIIIGIEEYHSVGDAPFAERDASLFYDVAQEKLGVPASNIQLLLGAEASYLNILEVTREWVRNRNVTGDADIYVFFAGHGRTDETGATAYLLPFNVRPSLIEASSIGLKSMLEGIAETTAGNVVAFIDACYSGASRAGESLVAGRPLIMVKKQEISSENLTMFSASDKDQIAKVLENAKHGAFSYFLLRALTGDGDQNRDGSITSSELNSYLVQMVGRSVQNQTPQWSGAEWSLSFSN